METEQSGGLLIQPKDRRDVHDFAFLVEDKDHLTNQEPSIFRHELLGLPVVPFLGKYSGAAYEFGQVMSLTNVDIAFKKIGDHYKWVSKRRNSEEVNIPEEIGELLLNIPAFIEENKKEESEEEHKGKNSKKGGKNQKNQQSKMTSFFSVKGNTGEGNDTEYKEKSLSGKVDLKDIEKPIIKKHNNQPTFIATDRVKFSWIIQLNNIEVSEKLKKEPLLITNYVMHTVLFPHISFERVKRLTAKTPIGVVCPKELRQNSGIYEFIDSAKAQSKFYSGLKMGGLRLEYSSVHLKGQSLCFSPNNMKIVIDKRIPIGIFWTVVLDETMQSNDCYLHWVVNDEILFGPIERICKDAKCLNDLFKGLEELLGNQSEVLAYTRERFRAK